MSSAKGFVEQVKASSTKNGTMYRIKLQGDPNYYGTAKKDPGKLGVKRGVYVRFKTEQNGEWWNCASKPEIIDPPKGEKMEQGGRRGGGRGYGKSPQENKAIMYQNAYAQANAFLALCAQHDMLGIAKNKKVGEKQEAMLLLLDETADHIFERYCKVAEVTAPAKEEKKEKDDTEWDDDGDSGSSEESEPEKSEDDWDDDKKEGGDDDWD
jgi:hypothetical protein